MTLSFSEYLLRDFVVEHAASRVFEFRGAGSVRLPAAAYGYLHVVLAGTARIALDEDRNSVELRCGESALLIYGAGHRIYRARQMPVLHSCETWPESDVPPVMALGSGTQDLRVLSIIVQLTRTLRSAPVNRALPHLLLSAAHGRPLCDAAAVEAACRGPGASAMIAAFAQLQLTQILRQVHDELREVFPVKYDAVEMGRLAAIVRRMREHPEQRWTVASLAREVGWSRSTFAARFQAYAGVGPITYAAQTRLTQAEAMLRGSPDLPLWEVARRVGYGVQGSFTRAFKAQFGVSPRQFVTRLQSGELS